MSVVVVLNMVQVEDTQREYDDEGEGGNAWVVVLSAQGGNLDKGKENGEAKDDNTLIEDEDKHKSGNECVVVALLL